MSQHFLKPCHMSIGSMSNLRNSHVALSNLGVKGHAVGVHIALCNLLSPVFDTNFWGRSYSGKEGPKGGEEARNLPQ